MCVQNRAVARKVIPDIVFSYLTPPQHHRYSSLNLCQALSSLGRIVIEFHGGGTLLVNQANSSPVLTWELAPSTFPSRIFRKKCPVAAIGSIIVGFTIIGSTKEFSVA